MIGPQPQGRADHVAVELPQALVLHRRVALPQLEEGELQRAIELEAIASNPFLAGDLCWGYRTIRGAQGPAAQVELVLASRRQVTEYLAGRATLLPDARRAPEAWVASEATPGQYLVLQGFGEPARLVRHRLGRALNLAAVASIVVLVALIAITPTLQLRARAIEAVKAYDDLHARSRNAVASREALVRSSERVQQIEGLLREALDPAQTLNLLTRTLGDDTSITVLRIKGRKVTLEGQTTNAAELMQLLGKQPGFEDIVAPAPATRGFGSNKDNFKIEFMLDASRAAAPEKAKP
ncbi:MAG TPA: PilN domain-containing protein [Alicycliphilus sp.]|nr:PilN domain-containing protein [Alicycliphilus sp.]